MPLPQPKTALNNACSVIFNNTLYTYSADAFQSLRLEPGAEWEQLTQGERVTGGVCVGSTTGIASTSAFFVVGGVGGSDGYQGLQKYTYATRQWESINLAMPVTHQRVGHGAVYINSTDSILLYAGNQDGSTGPTQATFMIGASAPHTIRSFGSPDGATAPASLRPILLPWSPGEAVLVGGSAWNTRIFLFSPEKDPEKGWVDSGASLAAPLAKDTSAIQAVVMAGDDGSKNLYTFDMSTSPNTVTRTVLYSAPGVPVLNSAPVRRRTARRGEGRGAKPLTLNNWPAYNSTLAPTVTRSNFAFAQGPDDMVVIAGGNDDDVLCMFNARENCWEDTDSRLGQIKLLSTETSSTSSSSATATSASGSTATSATSTTVSASVTSAAAATETPTKTAEPTVSNSSGPPINTILGAVLGGFFGLAILLVLVYMCIRRRRRRQAHTEAGHLRRASGASSNEKDGIGFAKDRLAFGSSSPGVFRGHQPQGSQSSFSSMAILMGRAGQSKSTPPGLSRKASNESRRDSSDSTFRAFKSTISKPIPHAAQPVVAARALPSQQQQTRDEKAVAFAASTAEPRPRNLTTGADQRGDTRRSSGWNRYWSGGSALNLLGFGNGNGNSAANNSRRTTLGSDGSSRYSDQYRITQDSATVPPLFPATGAASSELRMSLSRVATHSPTIAVYGDKLKEGLSGRIETRRPVSAVSDGSASAYSSGIPESVHDAWDPTASNQPWGADRSLTSSLNNPYSTPLAPASQGAKPPTQAPPRPPPPRQAPAPVRDDMSWLNLAAN